MSMEIGTCRKNSDMVKYTMRIQERKVYHPERLPPPRARMVNSLPHNTDEVCDTQDYFNVIMRCLQVGMCISRLFVTFKYMTGVSVDAYFTPVLDFSQNYPGVAASAAVLGIHVGNRSFSGLRFFSPLFSLFSLFSQKYFI